MPSARCDPRGYWLAKYRGLRQQTEGNHRIPLAAYTSLPDRDRPAAMRALAHRADELCRMLEHYPSSAVITQALELRAITQAQADALRSGIDPDLGDELTVRRAYLEHRSTKREDKLHGHAYRQHLRDLERWETYARDHRLPTAMQDLTCDHIAAYVEHLRRAGQAWDTRRHALIPLRRAASVGVRYGIPDLLRGERINERSLHEASAPAPDAWTLPELAAALARLEGGHDLRLAGVIVLGAFLGLRPSEIQRLTIADLAGDVLHVAARERKTRSSRRNLPIPPTAQPILDALAHGRAPTDALIANHMHGRTGEPMTTSGFATWARKGLAAATGRDLAAKWLRHSFATWAIMHRVPAEIYERYLGHELPGVLKITRQHYVLDQIESELRTIGIPALEPILAAAMAAARAHTAIPDRPGTSPSQPGRQYVLRLVQ